MLAVDVAVEDRKFCSNRLRRRDRFRLAMSVSIVFLALSSPAEESCGRVILLSIFAFFLVVVFFYFYKRKMFILSKK